MKPLPALFRLAAAAVLLTLAGCGRFDSAVQRIARAVPPAAAVQQAIAALDRHAGPAGDERRRVDADVAARLLQRVLKCAGDVRPSFLQSDAALAERLQDRKPCFDAIDAQLADTFTLLRVGLVLAQPPLRAPAAGVAGIDADEPVHAVRVAPAAAVAAAMSSTHAQVLDLVDGHTIRSLPLSGRFRNDGSLSPNGRAIALADGDDATRLVDVSDGETLLTLPRTSPSRFTWLAGRKAFAGASAGAGFFVDFTAARRLAAPATVPQHVLSVPDHEDQVVWFTLRSLARLKLAHPGTGPDVQTLKEEPTPQLPYGAGAGTLTSDGRFAVGAHQMLSFTALATLETSVVDLDPLRVLGASALPDPDRIVLQAVLPQQPGQVQPYVYSLSRRTLAAVDTQRIASTRFFYVAPLHKIGMIAGRHLSLADRLPTAPETPLSSVQAQASAEISRLRHEAQVAGTLLPDGSIAAQVPPWAARTRTAHIEALGLYLPSSTAARRPHAGPEVRVHVQRGQRPLVLVLGAVEPVRWRLLPERGAKLALVLLATGRKESHVEGAGKTPVVPLDAPAAFSQALPEYKELDHAVQLLVGRRIEAFQGRFEADGFVVGGTAPAAAP